MSEREIKRQELTELMATPGFQLGVRYSQNIAYEAMKAACDILEADAPNINLRERFMKLVPRFRDDRSPDLDALRQLSPPVPIAREELGKLLHITFSSLEYPQFAKENYYELWWKNERENKRELFINAAETFASSIAASLKEKGVCCEWEYDAHFGAYDTDCGRMTLTKSGVSKLGYKFCPFCSKPIKESKSV